MALHDSSADWSMTDTVSLLFMIAGLLLLGACFFP
jgi:hypothetical protein